MLRSRTYLDDVMYITYDPCLYYNDLHSFAFNDYITDLGISIYSFNIIIPISRLVYPRVRHHIRDCINDRGREIINSDPPS